MANTDIFVFGSNYAGRHGKGAALYARQFFGAIYGQGEGLQGRSYGIPTKDGNLRILSLRVVKAHVEKFLKFAEKHPEYTFKVTAIGTGLAGFKHEDIGPMFYSAPSNCVLPHKWKDFVDLTIERKYWIT